MQDNHLAVQGGGGGGGGGVRERGGIEISNNIQQLKGESNIYHRTIYKNVDKKNVFILKNLTQSSF